MRHRQARGFTLVEIMIVILIIGLLMSVAVPNFIRARENARQKTCISNLRLLDQAKESYTFNQGLRNGDPINGAAAWSDYSRSSFPQCPAGGTYTTGVVGTAPTCSLGGAPHRHVLP